MLSPRAIALQGVGFGPSAMAAQGLTVVDLYVVISGGGGGGGSAGVASYKKHLPSYEHEDDLVQLIHQQDDEVLQVIVMAVISGNIK